MGTGIVSVSLWLDGARLLSWIWMAIALIAWVVIAAGIGRAWLSDHSSLGAGAGRPEGLAPIAGTAVAGSALLIHGAGTVAMAALALAGATAVALFSALLRAGPPPPTGSVFMPTVSLESLAVLAGLGARYERASWLLWAALALGAAGLAAYPLAAARFEVRELLRGAGAHWVAGGSLAITALAASEISLSASELPGTAGLAPLAREAALVVWVAAIAWFVPLVVAELAAPRIRYDLRRWSTVFPVGMYAACSFQVARAVHLPAVVDFARVWTWVAVAVWLVVAGGAIRALAAARGGGQEPRQHEARRRRGKTAPLAGGPRSRLR